MNYWSQLVNDIERAELTSENYLEQVAVIYKFFLIILLFHILSIFEPLIC